MATGASRRRPRARREAPGGAARAPLGGPVGAFTDRITPLGAALDEPSGLRAAVLAPDDHRDGLAVLEEWVRGAVRMPPPADTARAADLVARIAADPAATGTARLAAIAGRGPRALQRLFRDEVGE